MEVVDAGPVMKAVRGRVFTVDSDDDVDERDVGNDSFFVASVKTGLLSPYRKYSEDISSTRSGAKLRTRASLAQRSGNCDNVVSAEFVGVTADVVDIVVASAIFADAVYMLCWHQRKDSRNKGRSLEDVSMSLAGKLWLRRWSRASAVNRAEHEEEANNDGEVDAEEEGDISEDCPCWFRLPRSCANCASATRPGIIETSFTMRTAARRLSTTWPQ